MPSSTGVISPTPITTSDLRAYRVPGTLIQLGRPADWRPRRFRWVAHVGTALVTFSNGPLTKLCYVDHHPGRGFSATCSRWPIDRLSPGQVVVDIWNEGLPGRTFATLPGRATRVGGRRAKTERCGPLCWGIGGEGGFVVFVSEPSMGGVDHWYEIDAVAAGPHAGVTLAQAHALVRSIRFLSTP